MSETAEIDIEQTRAALREIISARKMNNAAVSRESGIAYATLSAWLNDNYKGDNARVANDVAIWLRSLPERDVQRARSMLLPEYVPTDSAERFISVLTHAQHVPDMVVITAVPGVGKTTACEHYQRTHPNVWMTTAIPSAPSPYAMLEMLCDAMRIFESVPSRRNATIVKRMRGTNGLLIVDEAQHLGSTAFDELRSIHDAAKIGLALVGNESVFARIDGGGRRGQFAQVFSRVGMRVTKRGSTKADIEAMLDAVEIKGEAERKLMRAIAAKPGALRVFAKTLKVAHLIATDEGGVITERHLRMAWERLSDDRVVTEEA